MQASGNKKEDTQLKYWNNSINMLENVTFKHQQTYETVAETFSTILSESESNPLIKLKKRNLNCNGRTLLTQQTES